MNPWPFYSAAVKLIPKCRFLLQVTTIIKYIWIKPIKFTHCFKIHNRAIKIVKSCRKTCPKQKPENLLRFLIFIYKDYFHCQFTIFIPHWHTYQFCPPTPSYANFDSFTNRLIEHGKTKEKSNVGEWPICRSGALRRLSSRKAQEKWKYQTTFYILTYISISICVFLYSLN